MEKYISFNQKKIHYTLAGEGPVLVLLHGYLESLDIWQVHQEKLADKYTVVCIDLPGHGKTDHLSEVHSMPLMAEIVKTILDEEEIEQCVLVGHSMGGYATQAFARKYPERLKGIGLFHSQAAADNETAINNRKRTIEFVKEGKSTHINQFIPTLFAPENRERFKQQIEIQIEAANKMPKESIIAAQAGMMERESGLDVLLDSKVPVLFIAGKKDARIPIEKILSQAALPKTSELLLLGNAGHMGWIEEQSKTIRALDGFMGLCEA